MNLQTNNGGATSYVARPLLRMRALNPRVASFVPASGPGGQIDRGKLEVAVHHGFRIIRWYLDARQESAGGV